MAYDEELADRFRRGLEGMAGISEKRMMGGICFFLDGNMLGGADRAKDGTRRLMFRVGKDQQAKALTKPGATDVAFGTRTAGGLVFVDEAHCKGAALKGWISMALRFVSTLPPK